MAIKEAVIEELVSLIEKSSNYRCHKTTPQGIPIDEIELPVWVYEGLKKAGYRYVEDALKAVARTQK